MQRIIFIIFLMASTMLNAQSFGQNKVQYRDYDWQFISSPQFDVYYYGDEIELAHFTMEVATDAYEQIAKHLRWNLKKRVSIIVYHSHNEFQQTNVIGQYMQEGIGGVTELFKNRIVLPFEGDYAAFRHVIHHELVHAMINDLVYGGRMQNVISGGMNLRIPLWANEGLAEYLSMNWDTQADMTIRDLAINERIPTIRELEYFLAYKGGQSVWRFIATKYGREKIGEIFGLTDEAIAWLQIVPYKGSLPTSVPTDPLIYRWYEVVSVYGMTIKELIHEEFGDGIMSAIDFNMDIQRENNPNGDRVNVVLSGKFLPYKTY